MNYEDRIIFSQNGFTDNVRESQDNAKIIAKTSGIQ